MLLLVSNVAQAEIVQFTDEPYTKIISILHLNLPPVEGRKASGYYTRDAAGVLDGAFDIKHHEQGHIDLFETDFEILSRARGSFAEGTKSGTWIYDYVYDDGVDVFEQHTITITYKDGNCAGSTFDGSIGHIMSKTKHSFTDSGLCTPEAVRLKAYELWGAEYERRERNGEL